MQEAEKIKLNDKKIMSKKKHLAAIKLKEEKKYIAYAKLNKCPTSPRKMRLVADLIRGKEISNALDILKHLKKEAALRLEKLLLSAIANWQIKNEEQSVEEGELFVKEIYVDSAKKIMRIRPAPQGRAHKIRKRSNHVTLILGSNL